MPKMDPSRRAALEALLAEDDADTTPTDSPASGPGGASGAQPDSDGNYPVRLVLAVEGHETSDRRLIAPGALATRAFPQSLAAQLNPGHGGDAGPSVICGRLDAAERVPGPEVRSRETGQPFPEGTFVWRGTGVIFGEKGKAPEHGSALDLVLKGGLTGNSVDLNSTEVEMTFDPEPEGAGGTPSHLATDDDSLPPGATRNDDGTTTLRPPRPPLQTFTKAMLGMTTLVPVPAFAEAYVEVGTADGWEVITPSEALADVEASPFITAELPGADEEQGAIVAGAAGPDLPPISHFAEPTLEELPPGAPPVIDRASGRIYGWVGMWDDCHTGYTDRCVPPPRSPSAYGAFHGGGGVRAVDEAGRQVIVPTGPLTVGGGHAPVRLGRRAAIEHYDDVDKCAAQVHCGENDHGIWYSGVIRPGATPAMLFDVEASPPSGDWRDSARDPRWDMIGLHSVNSPGFRRTRRNVTYALAEDGHGTALVAAGAVPTPDTPPTPSGAVILDYDVLAERIASRLRVEGGDVRYERPDYAAEGEGLAEDSGGGPGGDGASDGRCSQSGCGAPATSIVLTKGDGGPQKACGEHAEAIKAKAGPGATVKGLADADPAVLELRRRRAVAAAAR